MDILKLLQDIDMHNMHVDYPYDMSEELRDKLQDTIEILKQGQTLPIINLIERYSKDDIRKYGDGWAITIWDNGQKRRRIMADGYQTKNEAEHDRKIFNARLTSLKIKNIEKT